MDKKKFEAYLRDKLSVLNETEIDEIVMEYLQHIDMRVADGVSEEEAIKDFGDIDELVNDLLDAYKIDRKEANFQSFEHRFKLYLNKSLDFINDVASSLMRKDSSEVISLIVQFVLILIAISILNALIAAVGGVIYSIFSFMPYFIRSVIYFIIDLVKVVLGLGLSVAIIYWFAKERVIDSTQSYKKSDGKNDFVGWEINKKKDSNQAEDIKVSKTEEVIYDDSLEAEIVEETIVKEYEKVESENEDKPINMNISEEKTVKTVKPMPHEKVKMKEGPTFSEKLMRFNLGIIRFIVMLILIPVIVVSVLMGIGYAFLVYLTIIGAGSLGLVLMFGGMLLIGYYFVIQMIKFVGGSKHEKSTINN